MENSFLCDLIIGKIKLNHDYVVDFFESNFTSLTPGSKYQSFILTSSIIINSLKKIGAFSNTKLDVDLLMNQLNYEAILKFEEYKREHNKVNNTFKHRSSIIEGRLNRENRVFFDISHQTLKEQTKFQLMEYTFELEQGSKFNNIYLNLFCFPNFNGSLDKDEQIYVSKSYLSIIMNHDYNELDKFKSKMSDLINKIIFRLNEDSYFITTMSNLNAKTGKTNNNCYIATLVYNDIEHPKVNLLRTYRDTVMSKNVFGKLFIKIYYKTSPKLVEILRPYSLPQRVIRKTLDAFTNRLK